MYMSDIYQNIRPCILGIAESEIKLFKNSKKFNWNLA